MPWHLTEELGEEDGFRCDMALGQGGCEIEEDTDWIFEPGFHGAHNYSELDVAEACQHMLCENALTHWIHRQLRVQPGARQSLENPPQTYSEAFARSPAAAGPACRPSPLPGPHTRTHTANLVQCLIPSASTPHSFKSKARVIQNFFFDLTACTLIATNRGTRRRSGNIHNVHIGFSDPAEAVSSGTRMALEVAQCITQTTQHPRMPSRRQ